MLRVDIGCGDKKREGFIGVDLLDSADVKCDIAVERLPFENDSVEHIFSSHCVEHIVQDRLWHVFCEFTRVAADDALIEVWHPYALHRDAHVFGHVNYLTEEIYYHIGYIHPEFYQRGFGGPRWVLEEVRYHLERPVLDDLRSRDLDLEYGINYLHNVVKELGVFIRVEKGDPRRDKGAFKRTVCVDGRDGQLTVLSTGPYVPAVRPMVGASAPQPRPAAPELTIRESAIALRRALARRLRGSFGSKAASLEDSGTRH
jgi:hypothetical protein